MEKDAASITTKKIKLDRIDGQGHPKIGNPAGDQSLDSIDRLPDEVLGSIISLLPTKEGARTQILSHRWRPLWRAAPLNLGADSFLSSQDRKRIRFISKILSDHPGPARRFVLSDLRLRYAKVDGWLRSQALNGLEEIRFSYQTEDRDLPCPLPPSVFRFAPTLCVASISSCDFPREMSPSLKFPCLKQLSLSDVFVLDDAIHSLLRGCPVLESLLLERIVGFRCLRINSPTLRSIGTSVYYHWDWDRVGNPVIFQDLIIEDAPCLERLLQFNEAGCGGLATLCIVPSLKLEILGLLSDSITKLHIGTTVFQKMIAISLTTSMRTVKVLALDSCGPNLDSVVDFLNCFPCLQKLYIVSHLQKSQKNKRSYNRLDPVECLESHLRQVVVFNYVGMKPDVDFAKFFVLNAKVLKKMVFRSYSRCSDKWTANQHRRLQLDNRASPGAQFIFRRNTCLIPYVYNQRTHELWMDDPFESRVCEDDA